MKTSVPVGPTSIIGWLVALGGLLPIIVKLLEEGTAAFALGGPEKWSAIVAIVALAITQIGRYLQAHAIIKAGGKA